MAGKWQLVELSFEYRKADGIVPRCKQAIPDIAKDIHSYRPVVAQRESIGHPAISGAEIKDLQGTAGSPFERRQNDSFEVAKAFAANSPLLRIRSAQILVGQRQIVSRVFGPTPLSVTDSPVVLQKLLTLFRGFHCSLPDKEKQAVVCERSQNRQVCQPPVNRAQEIDDLWAESADVGRGDRETDAAPTIQLKMWAQSFLKLLHGGV